MSKPQAYIEIVKFKRHFRIYFRNNHPAYIVGEDGDMYIFHRVTHSKSSGGKKTWEKANPIDDGDPRKIHIVKKEEKDSKGRFSLFKIKLKKNADVSYPEIKRAGSAQTTTSRTNVSSSQYTGAAQTKHGYLIGRAWIPSGKNIKTKKKRKHKRK